MLKPFKYQTFSAGQNLVYACRVEENQYNSHICKVNVTLPHRENKQPPLFPSITTIEIAQIQCIAYLLQNSHHTDIFPSCFLKLYVSLI